VRYIEIVAAVRAPDAELAAGVLRDVTGGGTWTDTPFAQADLESAATVIAGGTYAVHAYVPGDADRGGLVLDAKRRLTEAGIDAALEVRVVAAEDWAEAWKEHFHAERFGERIVVAPSWRAYDPRPGDVVLTLDPGMAFGTGQHETTRMCLEALERAVWRGARVLDVGCGSGILAIASAKLGAAEVRAVDVDPVCVKVTASNAASNAASNGVEVRVSEGSMGEAWPFETAPVAAFDVIVANIVARAIVEMAADLARALAPGGRLIASGIIAEREGETRAALEDAGLWVEAVRAMGEWRCIEAVPG
jgi:ribosomal protein L11 methyltransferase